MDYKMLKEICQADMPYFEKYGEVRKGKHGTHIFKDNGAQVLAVAHLDTVSPSKLFTPVPLDSGLWLMSRAMDDRLGAYIITEWLPKFGLVYDLLLTEGEEKGQSTAKDFEVPEGKQYNWMFEFDRMGTDSVMYQYDDKEWKEAVSKYTKTGFGSFSDIGDLEHLGCKGVNWACAYYNAHETWACCHPATVATQVEGFLHFFRKHSRTYWPHKKKKQNQDSWGREWNNGNYGMAAGGGYKGVYVPPPHYKDYHWCYHHEGHVHDDFWDDKAYRCLFCITEQVPPQIECHSCKNMRSEELLNPKTICLYCQHNIPPPPKEVEWTFPKYSAKTVKPSANASKSKREKGESNFEVSKPVQKFLPGTAGNGNTKITLT